MPQIQLLDPLVAERIAAGEVVERPASVIKELVENAIDAGATRVEVELEDGGRALIQVTDNGHGMPPEDLALCVARHATSKLKKLEDLDALHTLGFRGEALPSIAAVSELTLLSRPRTDTAPPSAVTAYALRARALDLEARPEPVTHGTFTATGSPHGTRVTSRALFAEVPARLKFLKSPAAEVGAVRDWIERLALAHPEVAFALHNGDRKVLEFAAAATEADRVRAVLGGDADWPIRTQTAEADGIVVRVHWLQGFSTPSTKKVVQTVNGRVLKDRLLQQALLAPFRQALLPGQFPALALFVELPPAQMDVNVHPTKTEVRFLESRAVFSAVTRTVERLIQVHGASSWAPGAQTAPSVQDAPSSWSWNGPASFSTPSPGLQTLRAREQEQPALNLQAPANPASPPHPLTSWLAEARYAGALFNTYLLFEMPTAGAPELLILDQHAAHERVRFEKLRARALGQEGAPLAVQSLLVPEAVAVEPSEAAALRDRLELLTQLGFEAELFGEASVVFRSVPTEWGMHELRPRLRSLLERLGLGAAPEAEAGTPSLDSALFERLASESCHSAIRAGDKLHPEEAWSLARELARCEHAWNCPHGRPTVVRVPQGRFEEWFQRRVPTGSESAS